jgi:heme exporter protein B
VPGAVTFLRDATLVLKKDLLVELRGREVLAPMLFFAVMVVFVFSFGFAGEGGAGADLVAGMLWVGLLLAATIGVGRTFEREREGDTFRALLLTPASRPAVYVGKLCGILVFMALCEIVVVPLLVVLFGAPLLARPGRLLLLLALGTVGLCAVGALLGATLMRTRGRDMMLAIALYPLVVPVVLGGARGTSALLDGDAAGADLWLRFLCAFDAVFVVLGLWIFEPLCGEA